MGKCSYHENEETKYACNECRKEFCQECYNILDDLEKHNYLHNIFLKYLRILACLVHYLI